MAGGILKYSGTAIHPLYVKDLSVTAGSQLMVDSKDVILSDESIQHVDTTQSFFEQQKGTVGDKLVVADTLLKGDGVSVTLVDASGNEISTGGAVSEDLADGLGKAYYDYKGMAITGATTGNSTKADNPGIALTYGLTKLEANKGKQIALIHKAGEENNLSVRLFGEGGFTVETDDKVIIGNELSNYLGKTTIKQGEVTFGANNSFGHTSALEMKADTIVNLGEYIQSVGSLTLADSATLNINTGSFTLKDGGHIAGTLTGDEQSHFNVAGGELVIDSSNADFKSITQIGEDGKVTLNQLDSLGSVSINNEGIVHFNAEGTVANRLTGKNANAIVSIDAKEITFNQDNSEYLGNININDTNTLTVTTPKALGQGKVNLIDSAHLTLQGTGSKIGQPQLEVEANVIGNEQSRINVTNGNNIAFVAKNKQFKGDVQIDAKSQVRMTDNGLIAGNIHLEDDFVDANGDEQRAVLDFDITGLTSYNGKITGQGIFAKTGDGVLRLTQDQKFDGDTLVFGGLLTIHDGITYDNQNGTIYVGVGGSMVAGDSAKINAQKFEVIEGGSLDLLPHSEVSGDIAIHKSGSIGGFGSVKGNVDNKGSIYVGSRLGQVGDNETGGTVQFEPGVLTITGDYTGHTGSTLYFGTQYSGDDSLTDRLLIEGKATGTSFVRVDNVHGLGDVTQQGIKIIDIGNHAESDIHLIHQGRTVGGVFEYDLHMGADGNWYLGSNLNPVPPVIPPLPPIFPPLPPGSGGNGGGWINTPGGPIIVGDGQRYRPEVGSYLANLETANTMFNYSASERDYAGPNSAFWSRINANFERFNNTTRQSRTSVHNYSIQLGSDFISTQLNSMPFKAGIMFGYGKTNSTTLHNITGYRSKGEGDGYAVGLYGSLGDTNRAYLDGWAQYVYFKNDVKGDQLMNENYKAKGFVASLEGGYAFEMGNSWFVQPQAQLTWMGVKAKDHLEHTGTNIRGSKNNLQTRLGVRFFGEYELDGGKNKLKPYMELNYLHNTKPYHVEMDNYRISQSGTKNVFQAKVGVDAKIGEQTSVWGNVSHSFGKQSYRDTKISVGFRYEF